MSSDTRTVAALGRPFTLGMLYDARQDKIIPGFALWDETILKKNTVETSQRSSEFQIIASDSIESKTFVLDVEASLKASFLSGLIEVGGSAKYLTDQKKFKNQNRVTFLYKATTNFKQLLLTSLQTMDKQQKNIINMGLATHVVTGIQYGANALFVFDSEKLDVTSVQKIQGEMEAVIKKIPLTSIEEKVDFLLTDEEKALTNTLSCKFYGDLILERNPATFGEVVKTYMELPKLLEEHGENAAALKVWLMPIKNLDSTAAEQKKEISCGTVGKAEDALDGLRQIEMRCNECLADRVSENFPGIRQSLLRFQKLCNNYTSVLQQAMKKTIPLIREGKEDENTLEKLFEDREKSPFSQKQISTWMDQKEREINIIRSCVDMMEGTNVKIIQNQSELDREVLDPNVEEALCFVFTSLNCVDLCLDAMTLNSPELGNCSENPWYSSDEVLTNMREKAKTFHDAAKPFKDSSSVRFLVTATENQKYKGATIYHYNKGKLMTEDLSKCNVPPVEAITSKKALVWYACDVSLDPNTANYNLLLSDNNKKVTWGERQEYPDLPERFDLCPQALSREGLTGRHYWEVEWGDRYGDHRGVAVAYKNLHRKGDTPSVHLGENLNSLCFGLNSVKEELYVGHGEKKLTLPLPCTGCTQVGVYLDWPAGTLSFYNISTHNTLSHLYTFRQQFTEPVYPGCFTRSGYIYFCPIE